jgi:hypothetical protein
MADIAYSTLTPRIQGEVPDCPDFFIESRIQEVAMEFFKESKAWRIDLDPAAVIKNASTYELEVPSKTAVAEVLTILHLTDTLTPKTEAQLQQLEPEWRTKSGTPKYFTQLSPDTFTIAPIPIATTAKAMSIRIAVYPTIAATRIDSHIFNDNYSALISGTLAKILLMTGKSWSDPNMGAVYAQTYNQELQAAKDTAQNGRVRTVRKVKYGGI